jgi:hypothetical protein
MVLSRRPFKLLPLFMAIALLTCLGCGGGNTTATNIPPTPTPTPAPSPTPTPTTSSALLGLRVENATVPPGGIYQYQLSPTEPKPMGAGSTGPSVPKGTLGPVRGVAVNDPSGHASGIAIDNGSGITVKMTSPNFTLGTDITYPLLTMTFPVSASATAGSSFPVSMDLSKSSFVDSSGQPYTIELASGTLTIGGSLSITDVIPGGGLLADRTPIKILGAGFTNNTKISIEGTTVFAQDTTFVSANEIDVLICNGTAAETAATCPNSGATFQLDGERVRAVEQTTNEKIEYFSYRRTDDMPGTSSNSLVASVHPMFASQVTFTGGTLPLPTVLNGTQFTGLALQNTSTTDAGIKLELLDAGNVSLVTPVTFTLTAGKKITRDVIADWFPSAPAAATKVRVTLTSGPTAIQMLGMQGDTATGTINPIAVTQ